MSIFQGLVKLCIRVLTCYFLFFLDGFRVSISETLLSYGRPYLECLTKFAFEIRDMSLSFISAARESYSSSIRLLCREILPMSVPFSTPSLFYKNCSVKLSTRFTSYLCLNLRGQDSLETFESASILLSMIADVFVGFRLRASSSLA